MEVGHAVVADEEGEVGGWFEGLASDGAEGLGVEVEGVVEVGLQGGAEGDVDLPGDHEEAGLYGGAGAAAGEGGGVVPGEGGGVGPGVEGEGEGLVAGDGAVVGGGGDGDDAERAIIKVE